MAIRLVNTSRNLLPFLLTYLFEKEKKKALFLELFLICRRIKVRCGTNQVAFIVEASRLNGQGLKLFMPFLREQVMILSTDLIDQ